ncbi:MAG: hypothetical protein RR540_05125 [Oscillospiraceae bacterium]
MRGEIFISAQKISIIILTIATLISCAAIILLLAFGNGSEKVSAKTAETSISTAIEYVLKDYDGHLAVFYYGENTPYMEFEIKTSSFSDYDKKLLMEGITANSDEEIRKIIEDYTG